MNALELLQALERRGVTLFAEGGKLKFRAALGAYADADRAAVATIKPELLRLLAPVAPQDRLDADCCRCGSRGSASCSIEPDGGSGLRLLLKKRSWS